jgi:archaellum component FlaC
LATFKLEICGKVSTLEKQYEDLKEEMKEVKEEMATVLDDFKAEVRAEVVADVESKFLDWKQLLKMEIR